MIDKEDKVFRCVRNDRGDVGQCCACFDALMK
jgi:hypothetical protein